MHKLIRKITLLAALAILFGWTILAHGQAFQLQQSGPQPYQYQPYSNYLTTNGLIASSPNAGDGLSSAVGKLTDAVTGIGGSLASWASLKLISYVLFVLSYIVGFIGSTVFTLAGLFVEFGLYLNTTILDGEVVQISWAFFPDFANLGFSICIIVLR